MCHWIKDVGQGDALSYETMIGRDLNQYRIHLPHGNKEGICRELFNCDIRIIKHVFRQYGFVIPTYTDAHPKSFEASTPEMNFLAWVNMHRENFGLAKLNKKQLMESPYYTIPDDAVF
ncbi:hypothetical protein JCM19233_752 [Vibrio astriarenae]|nr:hypothetical protein JCM19233_752 [Vibrio sp. C7]